MSHQWLPSASDQEDMQGPTVEELQSTIATLQATLAGREQEVEKTRVQLAGCLTAAEGHTADPARQGDYGWSVAYQRTLDLHLSYAAAVQEAARLREALGALVRANNETCSGVPNYAEVWDEAHRALKGA